MYLSFSCINYISPLASVLPPFPYIVHRDARYLSPVQPLSSSGRSHPHLRHTQHPSSLLTASLIFPNSYMTFLPSLLSACFLSLSAMAVFVVFFLPFCPSCYSFILFLHLSSHLTFPFLPFFPLLSSCFLCLLAIILRYL